MTRPFTYLVPDPGDEEEGGGEEEDHERGGGLSLPHTPVNHHLSNHATNQFNVI